MKHATTLMTVALAMLWTTAAAQTQIYESKEKGGAPVYSDTPAPGSKEVTLPAPNISDVPMPSVQAKAPAGRPAYSETMAV